MKKLLIAALLSTSLTAHAEFLTGNKLLELLNGSQTQQAVGMGYVAGVADVATGTVFCPEVEVTLGQLRDMTKNFLEKYPEHRSQTADTIVIALLKNFMPCKAPKKDRSV